MKKVLFVGAHRLDRSPSQRYRFEQYFKYLESNGFKCDLAYIITEEEDKVFYGKGKILAKMFIMLKAFFRRLGHVFKSRKYDLVFIQREAFMLGTTFFEWMFFKFGPPVIFDFDDAIWLPNVSEGNKKLNFLKKPEKTKDLIRMSHLVFAGNEYLVNYAKQYNQNVVLVPTTIDTDWYQPSEEVKNEDKVIIGWTGSSTTIQHLQTVEPILERLKEKYKDKLGFKIIGDPTYANEALNATGIAWKSETEVEDLQDIDIGIMPLPDSKWTQGKCGCKGLQYMAAGVATIMSPVGVNKDIIDHGENGFLATNDKEWEEYLDQLIQDVELRKRFGTKGRERVVERYSVSANKEKYKVNFEQLINS